MCCDGWNLYYEGKEPDGVCPVCGNDTFEGTAMEHCNYSKYETCPECGDAPCDDGC